MQIAQSVTIYSPDYTYNIGCDLKKIIKVLIFSEIYF